MKQISLSEVELRTGDGDGAWSRIEVMVGPPWNDVGERLGHMIALYLPKLGIRTPPNARRRMKESLPGRELTPAGYAETFEAIKAEVRSARIRVARTANTQMIELYWRLGRLIVDRQLLEGRRSRVIARLPADLQTEFPDVHGFSAGNLDYMRRFATAWPETSPLQIVGKLGWGQIQTLLDRIDNRADRDWYGTRSSAFGWSRNTLVHHISTQLKLRTGSAPDNFTTTLPAADSDAVRELVHDPVRLDFLALGGLAMFGFIVWFGLFHFAV